jgi:hypothetical protein
MGEDRARFYRDVDDLLRGKCHMNLHDVRDACEIAANMWCRRAS